MGDATPSPAPPTRRRLLFAFASVGLLLLSGIAAVLLAEVVVRLAAPQQLIQIRPDLWMPADTIGWRLRSDISGTINTGERTVRITSDRDGYRVGSAGRKEASTRVLLLGDSFVEAVQVEYEQTFGHLIESDLERRLGRPVAVRNAGVGGWSPDQYLLRARQLLARESFDLVLVAIFTGNDAIREARDHYPPRPATQRRHLRWPRSLSPREVIDAWLAPVNDALEVRSHFFILVKNQLAGLRMKLGMTADYFPGEFLRAQAASERWVVTGRVAASIGALADSAGSHVVFVLVPDRLAVYDTDLRRYAAGFGIDSSAIDLDQPTRLLGEQLRSHGLRVIDPLQAFRQSARSGPRLYGTVDPHFSPHGHALLAREVTPALAEILTGADTPRSR